MNEIITTKDIKWYLCLLLSCFHWVSLIFGCRIGISWETLILIGADDILIFELVRIPAKIRRGMPAKPLTSAWASPITSRQIGNEVTSRPQRKLEQQEKKRVKVSLLSQNRGLIISASHKGRLRSQWTGTRSQPSHLGGSLCCLNPAKRPP